MLLNFEVDNWSCFKNKTCFSMQAGPEHDPDGRLALVGAESRPLKVLPAAAIYGNNASGKTQFIRALQFLQGLMTDQFDAGYLPVEPYTLDPDTEKAPTWLTLQFVVDETIYELKLSVTSKEILGEELASYGTRSISRHLLYHRDRQRIEAYNEWGSEEFQKYVKTLALDPTKSFLAVSSMLLATTKIVNDVRNWFENTLCIISPDARYMAVEKYCEPCGISEATQEYLGRFDTGIRTLATQDVSLETFSQKIIDEVRRNLVRASVVRRLIGGNVFLFKRQDDGTIGARKLCAVHDCSDGRAKEFPLDRESDGTRRMLDLIPTIGSIRNCKRDVVFVVDEIDRSLHHLVTRAMVEDFISACSAKTRYQLIFTTHDLLLMDQAIFRRDEMYVTDKSPDGVANITDISSFKNTGTGLDAETNILRRYLDGRFGGIPRSI